ncbi:nucleotide exchange factor Fes1-domain-containing protein [Xylaria palmicola]|nr:nucleotide exchange factor Fes1-domain-containing protein [Xylaria palmicola]
MGDQHLNDLLRWSIENSASAPDGTTTTDAAAPHTALNPEALAALMGGPSDADLMRASLEAAASADPAVDLETRLVALDNLEQLIESLDNANLLARLGLWTPLLGCLARDEPEVRRMAAWCVGTAVQNNEPCQERLVALGGVERLVRMVMTEKETPKVRRKAMYALSSAVRNYQPAMNACAAELRRLGRGALVGGEDAVVDAQDMDAVDAVINALRAEVTSASE